MPRQKEGETIAQYFLRTRCCALDPTKKRCKYAKYDGKKADLKCMLPGAGEPYVQDLDGLCTALWIPAALKQHLKEKKDGTGD